MGMSSQEALSVALGVLPDGPMEFGAWIRAASVAGVDKMYLQAWPKWKQAGLLATEWVEVDGKMTLHVRKGA